MNQNTRIAGLVLAGAILCAGAVAQGAPPAAGSVKISDKAGLCALSVPADWKVGPIKSLADGPGGAKAAVSSSTASRSLAEVKPLAEQMMVPTRTFEDSSSRLWYAYAGNREDETNWYVAVPTRGGVCVARVSFKDASAEGSARKIALSLAPG